ncbi:MULTISPECIES: MarR family transcriptional regulator [Halorussus]|uniref:MarR family transcriptional regulator n=1 Tax=Halorussus TaxID=1070314 RepID=UPI0020A22FC9|nr:helix-turn-helix domain-containing protein [Halorussus vallis]USZ73988.1 MarR family transcriptional regulator [Halorussus vallis]
MSAEPAEETLDCVAGCSPSAKLVYKLLEYGGPRTQSELVDAAGLSRDAIRAGAEALVRCEAVEAYRDPSDARRKVYELRD